MHLKQKQKHHHQVIYAKGCFVPRKATVLQTTLSKFLSTVVCEPVAVILLRSVIVAATEVLHHKNELHTTQAEWNGWGGISVLWIKCWRCCPYSRETFSTRHWHKRIFLACSLSIMHFHSIVLRPKLCYVCNSGGPNKISSQYWTWPQNGEAVTNDMMMDTLGKPRLFIYITYI